MLSSSFRSSLPARKTLILGLATALATAAASVACSVTTVDGTTPSTDGGGTAADGAPLPSGEDGGTSTDGSTSADGSSGTATDYGTVSVTFSDTGTFKSLSAFAQFTRFDGTPSTAPSTCQTVVDGDCTSNVCGAVAPTDGGTTSFTLVSAWAITVSGARLAGVDLTPGADGKYAPFSKTGVDGWSGGETLSFASRGGEVLPFTGTVTAPPSGIALTAPVFAPPAKVEVDRTKPLVLRWTGGGAGKLSVSSAARTSDGGSVSIVCQFDASKGTAEIPASLVAKLPLGDGVIGTSVTSSTRTTAGTTQASGKPYAITLQATSTVKGGSGQITVK
jgi:hypothetical protein